MLKYKGDTKKVLEDSDIFQVARKLLDNILTSTGWYEAKEATKDNINNARVVLGFLNATRGAFSNRLTFFKIIDLPEKIKAIKNHSKGKK